MTWMFVQLWFLMLVAFLAGAFVTYFVLSRFVPHTDRIDTHPDSSQEGAH